MKNYYPEKPLLPYRRTTVSMNLVIQQIMVQPVDKEIKRMAYIMFRNESANGRSGLNHNYCGFQADSGRWAAVHDAKITGIVAKTENGTGKLRLFLAFANVAGCLEMLIERVQNRGLYIGGTTKKIWPYHIATISDLARAYLKEWVTGNKAAEPSAAKMANFKSMYHQAEQLFN